MKRLLCLLLVLCFFVCCCAPPVYAEKRYRLDAARIDSPEETPTPYCPKNGEIFVEPDYEGPCELEVIVDLATDCYVYIEYIGESESSVSGRELKEDAEKPYESDLAFYVKAGETVTKKIPDGIYQFFYATGKVFYGEDDLFGEESYCYSADELMDFYTNERNYIQYKVRIFSSYPIDFSTVPYEEFPTGSREP